MKIVLISQSGDQDGDVMIADGSTVGDVVNLSQKSRDESRWMARVNGIEKWFSHTLSDGDRVTIVAKKVAGA